MVLLTSSIYRRRCVLAESRLDLILASDELR